MNIRDIKSGFYTKKKKKLYIKLILWTKSFYFMKYFILWTKRCFDSVFNDDEMIKKKMMMMMMSYKMEF